LLAIVSVLFFHQASKLMGSGPAIGQGVRSKRFFLADMAGPDPDRMVRDPEQPHPDPYLLRGPQRRGGHRGCGCRGADRGQGDARGSGVSGQADFQAAPVKLPPAAEIRIGIGSEQ
jgi:hypothetical protein